MCQSWSACADRAIYQAGLSESIRLTDKCQLEIATIPWFSCIDLVNLSGCSVWVAKKQNNHAELFRNYIEIKR